MSIYPYISKSKCKNCKGEISVKRSRDKDNEFCSTSCVGKFRSKIKEMVICKFCRCEFTKSNKTKNIFCSKSCANKGRMVEYDRFCKRCGVKFISKNIANINRGKDIYCSNSCSNRKYDINENYFDKIDNQNKAYILGFIYADGCLSKNGSEIIIKIHNKDENILYTIKQELESSHPISILKSYKNHQCVFRPSSKKLYQSLVNIGLTPAKTFTINFPDIRYDLVRHFVRGYFDGDGCLSNGGRNRNLNFFNIFTASKEFKDKLVSILLIENIKTNTYERNNGFSINIISKESSNLFFEYLYKDALIFMDRKKSKFIIS